ncbi:MAG: 30S ribosomal protein S20 [Clostridiales bacterium]|nr:30S ribosomal protein S20 [Clostridiales bacterium]
MPNIKSAKKRVIVNKTKTDRNKSRNSALKTALKKANAAIDNGAADKEAVVTAAVKKIDQAAAKGLIHKNNAAHKKSAIVSKLNNSKA